MSDVHTTEQQDVETGRDPGPANERQRTGRRGFDAEDFAQRYALVGVWALVLIGFGIELGDSFLSWTNLGSVYASQTVLLIVALGLLPPLLCNDFDLSVASVLSLSAMLVATLNVNEGWPIIPAILVALTCAVAVGLINAMFIVGFALDSFIVTLGTSTVLAGVVYGFSDSASISGVSENLTDLVFGERFLGVALAFYFGLLVCAALWYVLAQTPLGRRMLFVGRGRNVARLTGINVSRVRIGSLVASAFFAGLAGVVFTGTAGGADPNAGSAFLLPAFAAAFLGSTAIQPGRFNALGTLVAVYFLVTGITGLQQLGVQSYVQNLFYGGALLVAITASRTIRIRRSPRRAAGSG